MRGVHQTLLKLIQKAFEFNFLNKNRFNKKPLFPSSDVESSQSRLNNKLAIVEEGDNQSDESDSQSKQRLKVPDQDIDLSSAGSSAEHLAANTRANKQSTFYNAQSAHRVNEIPDSGNSSRRPSVLLQEILSSRRPSAIMASLRRGSTTLLNTFRSKQEDPHDHTGAKSPEAIEYRRKNRRYGE